MALTSVYVNSPGRLKNLFEKIQSGQAPDKFTIEHLKDIGFKSTNDRPFIKVLKELKFLTSDGSPTERYHNYRDKSKASKVLGTAVKEAYKDLFVIHSTPSRTNKKEFEGKFKSTFNLSDTLAELAANTFFSLYELADFTETQDAPASTPVSFPEDTSGSNSKTNQSHKQNVGLENVPLGFHYNIQVHLPATKDIEVYNAIFKSLKDNLFA